MCSEWSKGTQLPVKCNSFNHTKGTGLSSKGQSKAFWRSERHNTRIEPFRGEVRRAESNKTIFNVLDKVHIESAGSSFATEASSNDI